MHQPITTAAMLTLQYDLAIEDYQAITLPDEGLLYFNRGLAYAEQGKYARAIQDFYQIIKLKPDDALAFQPRLSVS